MAGSLPATLDISANFPQKNDQLVKFPALQIDHFGKYIFINYLTRDVAKANPTNMSPYLGILSDTQQHHLDAELKQEFPHIDEDPVTLPTSLDPFTINTTTGFMPLWPPQVNLPPKFEAVATLVESLPVVKVDGNPGLLATYQLGPTVDNGDALPDLIDEIDALVASDGQPDLAAVTAVFRDYAFIASAYLLEPCWERYKSGLEGYGLGRQVLPKAIARPLVKTAKMYVFSRP